MKTDHPSGSGGDNDQTQLATGGAAVAKYGSRYVTLRYTVAVAHNIILKEITESDSVLVYIPIIDYSSHIYLDIS